MHRHIDESAVPEGRTVVRFRFPDVPSDARDWWLVITRQDADVCDVDPGFDSQRVDVGEVRDPREAHHGDPEHVGRPWIRRPPALEVDGVLGVQPQPGQPGNHSQHGAVGRLLDHP